MTKLLRALATLTIILTMMAVAGWVIVFFIKGLIEGAQ